MSDEHKTRLGNSADREWLKESLTPSDVRQLYVEGVRHDIENHRDWAQFAARVIHGYD